MPSDCQNLGGGHRHVHPIETQSWVELPPCPLPGSRAPVCICMCMYVYVCRPPPMYACLFWDKLPFCGYTVLGEVPDFIIDCTSYYLDVHHIYVYNTTLLFHFPRGGGMALLVPLFDIIID